MQCASVDFSPYESVDREFRNSNRVKIDLRRTEYPILMNVATNSLGWRVWSSRGQSRDERDIIWNDNYISEGQIRQLRFYQRINHFPGSSELGKKSCLAANLQKMKGPFRNEFYPQTWLLPKDAAELRKQGNINKDRVLEDGSDRPYYICKPEASSQGKGIFLFNSLLQLPRDWQNSNFVVQKYIQRPFLVDGLKFDFRIYVLLRSINPLRVYVYRDGLTRFATCKYQPPSQSNCGNVMMHLTNYAINKRNPDFVFNNSDRDDNIGHKRSYTSVVQMLRNMGANTEQLQTQIDEIIVKTILSGLSPMSQIYKRARQNKEITSVCFEILGFDIMVDERLTPYLIQVNHTPSFVTDTPLDYSIKKNLILDTLNMARIDIEGKREFLGGRNVGIDKLISDAQLKEMQMEQDYYQQSNRGGFRRVFPIDNPELTKIHDLILGIKPVKLYRINYQNLNKNRISQLNKRNKSSVKRFPNILQLSDSYYERRNYFEHPESEEEQSLKYRVDRSMPIQSLIKSLYKTEEKHPINQSTIYPKSRHSYKNMWIFNQLEKTQKTKELQPLRLKNLEIDFVPPSRQAKSKNSIAHTPVKSLRQYQFDLGAPQKRVSTATKSILFSFQKQKKENEQAEPSPDQKLVSSQNLPPSPSRITLIQQDASRFRKSVRLRQHSQLKPNLHKMLLNYSRRFSCQQKRLIMGYD